MISQGSPQDTEGTSSGSDASDTGWFVFLEQLVVATQGRLVQDQGSDRIHQRPAQVNIAGLEHPVTLAFALASTGVIATADQAGTAENLAGMGVVIWIADSSRQAGDLNGAQAFDLGPDLVRGLREQVSQAAFESSDVRLNFLQQGQVMLQEFAADQRQFSVGQEHFLGIGDDLGGDRWPQAILVSVKNLDKLGRQHPGKLVWVGADPDQVLQGLAGPEVRLEQGRIALFGFVAQDHQTREDAVQVPEDLVLEHGLDLDFAQADTVELLQL